MTRFLLIRHAAIDAHGRNLPGRTPGVHLNEKGRAQAQALARRMSGLPVVAIYSSPLERAVETAGPIAKLLGLEIATREDFLELAFGDWTGHDIAGMAGDASFQRFNTFRSCTPAPGGEFMLQAQARMIVGLDALRARHPGQAVAVISHGDLIKAAVAHYAGIHLDLFQRIEISPASVSTVEIDDASVRIIAINDTGGIGVPDGRDPAA
jgi:probable phosphomutase (TIGR03848 family)